MENYTQIQFVDTFGQVGPQGIIDVSTNVQMSINFAVGDIKDPFSKKGIKSYKFNIPGNKSNNLLLNNYFDINILDGTYDHNKKQKVVILRNGIIVLDNAYMQLLQINKIANDTEFSDQLVSYDVEIGNDTTSFFTDITNKYLSDLDFSDMNHVYSSTNVVASFPYSAIRDNSLGTGGYKFLLPWIQPAATTGALPHTGVQYHLEECKPAISCYEYWNRIHQAAGYQWQWTGYDSNSIRMNKLFIPYNGEAPQVHEQQNYEVIAETLTPFTNNSTGFSSIPPTPVILDIELRDVLNQYDPGTGLFTSLLYTGSAAIDVKFEITYDLTFTNPSTHNVILIPTVGFYAASGYDIRIGMKDLTNTNVFSTRVNYITPLLLVPGTTSLASGTVLTQIMPITGVNVADVFNIFTQLLITPTGSPIWEDISTGASITVTNHLAVTHIKMQLIPRADTYGYGIDLNMNDFVPQKIKQSDFIKAIANMYNLVIDVSPENDKKIIYRTRDNYYDAGTVKNWTEKLSIDKESNISFISNSNSKKIILSYKLDKDAANVDYNTSTKEIYGQLEYELENENIKGTDTKEILFSPTPIGLTQFGAYTPFIDGVAPKNNIRILLDGGVRPTGLSGTQTYDIIDYNYNNAPLYPQHSDSGLGLTTYPMLTHFDNPDTPQFDINFGLCDFYYFDFTSQTNNNLYSMFWRRTISQIDSGKLFTGYFYLSEYDISLLKLNDKIWVKDAYYNINSLTYDPNSFGPTKVVLMTIDDNLKLLPPSNIFNNANNTFNTASKYDTFTHNISLVRYDYLNWSYADPSVEVHGVGNNVSADVKNIVIYGDNIVATLSDSVYSTNVITDDVETRLLNASQITIGNTSIFGNFPFVNGTGTESAIQVNTLFPNDASGINSLSIGTMSIASGDSSFAGGGRAGVGQNGGTATGSGSFAFGANTFASGIYSFNIGQIVTVGNGATNAYAFCGGYDCKAAGATSFAFGFTTLASGQFSTAIGINTQATGFGSTTFGDQTLASGPQSFATGLSTQATGYSSMAGGNNALSDHYAEWARGSASYSGSPDAQYGFLSGIVLTPGATPAEIWLDGVGQRFTIPGSTSYYVEITCLAVDYNVNIGDSASFIASGIIKNVGGTTTTVTPIVVTQNFADASMVGTVLTVAADDPNDCLSLFATGIAATGIKWNCQIKYVKIAF